MTFWEKVAELPLPGAGAFALPTQKAHLSFQKEYKISNSRAKLSNQPWLGNMELGYFRFHVATWKQFHGVFIVTEKRKLKTNALKNTLVET